MPELKHRIEMIVNGEPCAVDVEPHWTLRRVIRKELGLTGTKFWMRMVASAETRRLRRSLWRLFR